MRTSVPAIEARGLRLGYGDAPVIRGADLDIPAGSFTALIGPNASGKSTLLRGLARLIRPTGGTVLLAGRPIVEYSNKEAARMIGLLPQKPHAPDGITVRSLVERGRFAYHGVIPRWTDADESAVDEALTRTNTADLSERAMHHLSGGQQQRVWVALLLAQDTDILLLDEPTTFLDLAHQYELLELLRTFNREGKTIVTVLHDLNQAARYASDVVVLSAGEIVASGSPESVYSAELVDRVFGIRSLIAPDPVTRTPMVVPLDPDSDNPSPQMRKQS